MKKITAVFITVVLLFALASNALAVTAPFPDVRDETMAREVGVLQMLGVISGDGNGNFVPDGTLTRAAFCKMAVIIMGRGSEEPLYRTRTIFPDVRGDHWARGYINLAVTGEKKIILGTNDGTFKPDTDITYAQAVTILLRILGYNDADAGMLWPEGYLTLAADTGLADGLGMLPPAASITRAQAAHLFCNLLGTPVKGGASYISTLGSATEGVIIMQLDVRAADGSGGAIRTSKGVLKTVGGVVPPSILGLRGTLLQNTTNDKVLTFLPDVGRQTTITAAQVSAGWIKDSSGIRYDIPAAAPAYTSSETKTYGTVFIDIAAGMKVTLYYSVDGKVDSIFVNTSKSDAAVVVGTSGAAGSIGALTGGDTGYTINKNGAPAAAADIRPYDVVTYDRAAKILNVSDFRLTGYYENSWPTMSYPLKITVMGHEFAVLPSGADSLASFTVGQVITLLFTSDMQVAGAVTSGMAGSTAVGIVQPGISGSSASVRFLNGLVVSGNPSLGEYAASQLSGELVTVYSTAPGYITLSKLSSSAASGDLDLTKMTLGAFPLSPAVKVFERVGTGSTTQLSLSDLTQERVSASKVLYVGIDYAGRVDTLVLNDVTGDRYIYGILKEGTISGGSLDGVDTLNRSVSVINYDNKTGTTPVISGFAFTNGAMGGVAVSGNGESAAGIVTLTEVKNVSRSAFYTRGEVSYLQVNGLEIPVAANVQCYNNLGKTWFPTLSDVRAFSETLTVYYDRAPSEGGKIRLVVAG